MNKEEEKVLVVPAEIIFKEGRWHGLKQDNLDYYLDLIKNNYQFKKRENVENDPSWQQIIPYIVFNYQNKFFIYKYLPKAGESRLVDTYQVGVGGHINQVDTNGKDILETGMMREWGEEVSYNGRILDKKFIGLLNDDSRPVETVHLGLVYHFFGDSPDILVKETEKIQGELVSLERIGEKIKDNDGVWIKIVYEEYLKNLLQE